LRIPRFTKLESVAHVGENLLSKLRDRELTLSLEITTALLQMVDAIRQMLASVEAIGNEGERNDRELIKTLTRLLQAVPLARPQTEGLVAAPPEPAAKTDVSKKPSVADVPPPAPIAKVPSAPPDSVATSEHSVEVPEAVVERGEAGAQGVADGSQQQSRGAASESSIRVDVVLLDKLMNLVGELVLARNQILQFSNGKEDVGLIAPSQRLNLITTELQEGV
jgi:two-component system chemotaxis sensor kinase CheA